LAGLDSIIQVAGRINRNRTLKDNKGKKRKGKLYIYNFNENLINLDYINERKIITKNILQKNRVSIGLLSREIINNYYEGFFFRKKQWKQMQYLIYNGNVELYIYYQKIVNIKIKLKEKN
jgi:CRISPR-associated endonuclease/helicase Cas3